MLRGSNSNNADTSFLDTRFRYPVDLSTQPQLCGNLPVEFQAVSVNYLGINNGVRLPPSNKYGKNEEANPEQKLQFSLNNQLYPDGIDRKAGISNHNPISTGLRLSYDDDNERKLSLFSGTSRSMKTASLSSVFSSLSNDVKRELDQHEEELNRLISTQEENMVKGLRDIKHKRTSSFLNALEKGIAKRLHEKDLELQTITRKNKELVENVKQVTADAQNWCYMAKYNESIVNILKTNLQQAMESSTKEGIGESDTDDAASCIDPNNYLAGGSGGLISMKNSTICRSCRGKEVSVLLMPCRHLCLCKECAGFVSVCPVCKISTTGSFEVYLS